MYRTEREKRRKKSNTTEIGNSDNSSVRFKTTSITAHSWREGERITVYLSLPLYEHVQSLRVQLLSLSKRGEESVCSAGWEMRTVWKKINTAPSLQHPYTQHLQ